MKGSYKMSGYKRATVTISEQEYRRLHEADMQRRFGGRSKPKQESPERAADVAKTIAQMENRQRQLEEAMRNIDHDLSAVGSDAIQDILAQNARGHERLAEFVEEYRTNVSDSLAVLSQRFSERILEEREQYQQGLQYLSQRLDVNQHKEEAKENLAREWLRRSAVFSEFIDGQFDHERF